MIIEAPLTFIIKAYVSVHAPSSWYEHAQAKNGAGIRDFSKIGRVAGFVKTHRQPSNRLRSTDLQRLEAADTEFAQDRETFTERQVRLRHKIPSLFQEYPPTH